jgi:4-amino-4-deoxy-L-arabinose transferase-like glycosyltransferase
MRERRDYVVPYFNDKYRFDKPPFIYWAQIASYRVFGESDFGARFPSAVAAALTAILLFVWGKRLADERVGWWAAIIFSLCLQVFAHGKAAVADMWLVFFVTAGYWVGYELMADWLGSANAASAPPRRMMAWRIGFYVALAFAFLAKGPLGWMPLVTVGGMKFFLGGRRLNQRFWFTSGSVVMIAIVSLWGVPALMQTNGEFFWVGIGRHVVERSFGALEGHGGQSWQSYLMTLPFYFVTVFVSFLPWSIKLPALSKRLWRERDLIDNYLILGVAIVFLLMTIVKTKLPHYTLIAFPLLSILMARHLAALGAFRFARRAAIAAVVLSLSLSLLILPQIARVAHLFPSAELFEQSRDDLLPEMEFANVNYFEPSVVWYFRSRAHGFFRGVEPDQVQKFMTNPGPRFVILPTALAKSTYPELPAGWKSYTTSGIAMANWKRVELTMILKPMP